MDTEIKKTLDIFKKQKENMITQINQISNDNEAKLKIIENIAKLDELILKYQIKLNKSK